LCRRAPCVISCPSNALFRDKATDAVLLLHEECIGCSECVDACPFGMASLHPSSGLTLICDLCGGDPACVKRCATGAIVYTDEEAGPGKKRQDIAVRSIDNSSSRTSDHE
jgi:Fe-S-cluster-containing dehydrogenase component